MQLIADWNRHGDRAESSSFRRRLFLEGKERKRVVPADNDQ